MVSRASLDVLERGKQSFTPARYQTTDHPATRLVTIIIYAPKIGVSNMQMTRVLLLLCFFKTSVMLVWFMVSFDDINFNFILGLQNYLNNFYSQNFYYILLTKHDL